MYVPGKMWQARKTSKTEPSAWVCLGASKDTVLMQNSCAGAVGTWALRSCRPHNPVGDLAFILDVKGALKQRRDSVLGAALWFAA